MSIRPIPKEKRAHLVVRRAMREAEAATGETEKAILYLANTYSERRWEITQVAQVAAQLAMQRAQAAEQALLREDYDAAIVIGNSVYKTFSQAKAAVRLATREGLEPG
jgi:hypothetical protein